jgi:Cu/Zn superoxide dismutase
MARAARGRKSEHVLTAVAFLALIAAVGAALADSTPQTLPFSQDWSNTDLIHFVPGDPNFPANDWSRVPGIEGFASNWVPTDQVDASNIVTCLAQSTPIANINADRTDANSPMPPPLGLAGLAEFELTDPVVAIRGVPSQDCPYLKLYLDTTGKGNIRVQYDARDIDGGGNNSTQPVLMLFRAGSSGVFSLVDTIPDATDGPFEPNLPGIPERVTQVDTVLPSGANNRPDLEVVIATGNYAPPPVGLGTPTPNGNDEWVGIDSIVVTGEDLPTETPTPSPTVTPTPSVVMFNIVLEGCQEVPQVDTAATGSGTITVDTTSNMLSFDISFSGLSSNEIAAHIHGFAPRGMEAGVLFTLPAGSPKTGVWSYMQGQEAGILAGQTYVNIHSTANDGGEIRGQIDNLGSGCPSPTPTPTTTATATPTVTPTPSVVTYNIVLEGCQEVPPVDTAASGSGTITVDTTANTATFDISFSGLSTAEIAAHIHGFAFRGDENNVLFTLPPGSPKTGVWNYTQDQEARILAGETYVNIHSMAFDQGEIRGQIDNLGSGCPTSVPAADLVGTVLLAVLLASSALAAVLMLRRARHKA